MYLIAQNIKKQIINLVTMDYKPIHCDITEVMCLHEYVCVCVWPQHREFKERDVCGIL